MNSTATESFRPRLTRSPAAMLGLLLALMLWFGSNSISGFGRGGEEDEGSGIGGTGLLPVPGSETGLGGTGFRPFVGMTPNSTEPSANVAGREHSDPLANPISISVALEHPGQRPAASTSSSVTPSSVQADADVTDPVEVIALLQSHETIPQSMPVLDAPLPRPVEVISQRNLTFDSGPVLVTEQIQRDIDINVRLLTAAAGTDWQETNASPAAAGDRAFDDITDGATDRPLDSPLQRAKENTGADSSFSLAAGQDLSGASPASELAEATDRTASTDPEPSWYVLAALINNHQSDVSGNDGHDGAFGSIDAVQAIDSIDAIVSEADRAKLPGKRPGRLRRPELPAVQSARPPQRVTILPPRIRPLGL